MNSVWSYIKAYGGAVLAPVAPILVDAAFKAAHSLIAAIPQSTPGGMLASIALTSIVAALAARTAHTKLSPSPTTPLEGTKEQAQAAGAAAEAASKATKGKTP